MNLNFPADLKFFECVTTPLFVTPSWPSLLRIFLWFVFFLGLAHFLIPAIEPQLPYKKEMQEAGITPLASTPSDPRYMRLDHTKVKEKSIIWVGGSSLAIKKADSQQYRFLPAQVQTEYTPYVSIKMASRLLDTYTMTLDAIERKPDVLFVALNPFWIMNDQSAFFKTNLMNRGTNLWLNKKDWPLIALLSSPGNMLWAAFGARHNVIANGYDYLKLIIPDNVQQKASKQAKKGKEAPQKLSYKQPLLFWISQRHNTQTDFTSFDAKQWQVKAMMQNDTRNNDLAQNKFRDLLHHIKKSNIPTLIYLAPTDYSFADTAALEHYRAVQAQINQIADDYKSDNIHFVAIPEWVYGNLVFTDYLHLNDSANLPEFLAQQIYAIIEKNEALE